MSSSISSRSFSLSLPRDYMRRRKIFHRVTLVLMVILLASAASYVIVHYSGTGGFVPHS